ncbi:MAG: NADH:ubiquinone reductase (Na(+)-transporting) subunit C [Flavobacteriales bacterium]|nr:NADH:ubiquinone reductase (Na(+)-transporting) subunit C [Flavobacteriales bacterium]MDG1780028.1 NADH:ubiquinone reductase (Na(+)-transporting) subunit C [Flavobacteriales bacterium]MDG2246137.1 NADH:ubiquinone reductase (Na(+)-transporting) subunit C [Flavobacteriales bacterium]
MAINKNSNGYTFLFSIIMVVVVGSALAYTSQSLKPLQKANEADKKMVDILGAIKVPATRANAKEEFSKYVVERISVKYDGSEVNTASGDITAGDKTDPFNIDVKKEYRAIISKIIKSTKKDPEGRKQRLGDAEVTYPLYVCEKNDTTFYVAPVVGTGLWGPIWGYVALLEDGKTFYGTTFDHKTETPGLGAEIKESFFTVKFEGKTLNTSSETVFEVKKGGAVVDEHSVDGITGGTITSKGVGEMLNRTLPVYVKYLSNTSNQKAQK